ncbi:MAG: endonuclease/exonuclease/phosphatase family protein [Muribaculaceae bacterium]|nr:endonuclease/exonuclease/phosphatase family protein [Muribaculaceae bacterium]
MNLLSTINKAIAATIILFATSCDDLAGDNSDYDFDRGSSNHESTRLPDSYRLATYNTHRCAPLSNVANYNNTALVISLIDADVIALQELDNGTNRHAEDQLYELARRTNMYPIFLPCVTYTKGSYGIGLLCKEEPISTYTCELPGVEMRGMLLAEFKDFVFICTHLCVSSADNRTWSFDIINRYLGENYSRSKKPIFLAGDLNTTSLPSVATDNWQSISTTSVTYFPTSKRIDYILAYKGNNASYNVLQTMVPSFGEIPLNEVSDHFPVIVDISKNPSN